MDNLHAPTVASGATSPATASGAEPLPSLRDLIAQKANVEAELSALGSVLDSHGVDMTTSLLTADGFPRADIDVAQIRTTRARIVRLKNDYKAVMKKLEVAVEQQFAAGKAMQSSSSSAPSHDSDSMSHGITTSSASIEAPFARINAVAPGSPAEQAGLQPGDKVTLFGTVNWTNHERLSKVAQVVQQHENQTIVVKVLRETAGDTPSQTLELSLTPRQNWGGRGMLGCHLVRL